jgi:hypothetical protein
MDVLDDLLVLQEILSVHEAVAENLSPGDSSQLRATLHEVELYRRKVAELSAASRARDELSL